MRALLLAIIILGLAAQVGASEGFTCAVRSAGFISNCLAGETRIGGGCSSAMDGCYPGSSGWVASGPLAGTGTAHSICCTQASTIELATVSTHTAAMPGTSARVTCPAGKTATGGGAYCGSGWSGNCIPDSTGVTCTSASTCSGTAYAVCVQSPPATTTITRISGTGSAVCPADTTLIGGGWSGLSTHGYGYPSGNTFLSSGTAYAVCAKQNLPQYMTRVGGPTNWVWRTPLPGELVQKGGPDNWSWQVWTPASGLLIPQGTLADWNWLPE